MRHSAAHTATIVIVGAGHAGVQAAASLRDRKFAGQVILVDAEARTPYQRPPLSKGYLSGTAAQIAPLRPREFYDTNNIDLVRARVVGIDRTRRTVSLDDGRQLAYDHLILATGARNRNLSISGANAAGAWPLRTADDARAMRRSFATAREVVVIGAGFVGLEVAAAAREQGRNVSVIEAGNRVMARAVSSEMSQYLTTLHTRAGVTVRHRCSPTHIDVDEFGHAAGVRLDDGTTIEADLVVIGIGVQPNTELAVSAGLAVDNGVCVDEYLRTTDPAIWAIGDCASVVTGGTRQRLESVQNAVDHARHVAAQLVGNHDPYQAVPWFWTHQYGAKLQIAGATTSLGETVVLGSAPEFSVLRFDGDVLTAVESVNRPGDHLAARRLLAGSFRPGLGDARAPGFSLKDYAQRTTVGAAT